MNEAKQTARLLENSELTSRKKIQREPVSTQRITKDETIKGIERIACKKKKNSNYTCSTNFFFLRLLIKIWKKKRQEIGNRIVESKRARQIVKFYFSVGSLIKWLHKSHAPDGNHAEFPFVDTCQI